MEKNQNVGTKSAFTPIYIYIYIYTRLKTLLTRNDSFNHLTFITPET